MIQQIERTKAAEREHVPEAAQPSVMVSVKSHQQAYSTYEFLPVVLFNCNSGISNPSMSILKISQLTINKNFFFLRCLSVYHFVTSHSFPVGMSYSALRILVQSLSSIVSIVALAAVLKETKSFKHQ